MIDGTEEVQTRTMVRIHNLRLNTLLGVYEKERKAKREVVFNVELEVAKECSGVSDSLDSAVDYSAVRDKLVALADRSEARLLEHLAHNALYALLEDPRITSIVLTVEKPAALRLADGVSVIKSWRRSISLQINEFHDSLVETQTEACEITQ